MGRLKVLRSLLVSWTGCQLIVLSENARAARQAMSITVSLVVVLALPSALALAGDVPATAEIAGTVAAKRSGAVQVTFEARSDVVPRTGDRVAFSTEIDGIAVDGGSGHVVEVGSGWAWVEIDQGRPGLGMRARIVATGKIDPNAEFDEFQRRAAAGQCEGVRASLRQRADAGNLHAATLLGWFQLQGTCGPREKEAGLGLIRKAAKGGVPRAMQALSLAHGLGVAGPVDKAAAVSWAQRAAATGDPWGSAALAACHLKGWIEGADPREGARLMKLAADAGIAAARAEMGELYHLGTGVPRDTEQALRYLQRALEQGERTRAPARLGWMYERGEGVPRDPERALGLYRQAAEAGNRAAMVALGRLYEQGLGVARDRGMAIAWYERALPNPRAQEALTRLRKARP